MGFLLTFLIVYGLANVYIGNRFLYCLKTLVAVPSILYWVVFILVAASPILSRILARSGIAKAESLFIIGDWWLAVTYWSVLLWLKSGQGESGQGDGGIVLISRQFLRPLINFKQHELFLQKLNLISTGSFC